MELMGMFAPLLVAVVVLMVLGKLIAGAADKDREAVESEGGRLEFAPNRSSFWGVYLFLGCLAYVLVGGMLSGFKSSADIAGPVLSFGFAALLLMAFPGTIVVDKNGIGQVFWLRGRKNIAWKDVSKVTVDEKRGEVKIKSKSGVKILHSRQLPDQARLLAELDQHCTEKLVPTTGERAPKKAMAMSGPAA